MLRRLPLVAACAAFVTLPAAADDWPQFRRDERRSAASKDRLTLPLTEVWSVPGQGVVAWKGRTFYMGRDGDFRAVVCADLRSGATLWRQRLTQPWRKVLLLNERQALAVSESGVVFAPDVAPGPGANLMIASSRGGWTPRRGTFGNHFLRAFRATDGAPLSVYSSAADVGRITPQIVLSDAAPGQGIIPVQSRLNSHGPFLLRGNEVLAATLMDAFVRWTPGIPPALTSFAHLTPQPSGDMRPMGALLGASLRRKWDRRW